MWSARVRHGSDFRLRARAREPLASFESLQRAGFNPGLVGWTLPSESGSSHARSLGILLQSSQRT